MSSIRLLVMCLAAVFCASCKSLHTVEGDYRFADHPGYGLVVISTRIDNRCATAGFKSGALEFSSTDGKKTGLFLLDNTFIERDFQNPPGYFFVRSLPQGEYRILGLSFHGYRSSNEIGRTFTVASEKTTYLGEFSVEVPNCKRFTYRVTDMWERDEQLLKKRVRIQPEEQVQKQVLR